MAIRRVPNAHVGSRLLLLLGALSGCDTPDPTEVLSEPVVLEFDLWAMDGRGSYHFVDGELLEEVNPEVDRLSDINLELAITEAADGVQLRLLPQVGATLCLLDEVSALEDVADAPCTEVAEIQLWSNGADDTPLDVTAVAFQVSGLPSPLSAVFSYENFAVDGTYTVTTDARLELLSTPR